MPHGSNSHGKSAAELEITIGRVLTIFRGIVQFFVDYLWLDRRTGVYHSGNSLEIESPKNPYISIYYLYMLLTHGYISTFPGTSIEEFKIF